MKKARRIIAFCTSLAMTLNMGFVTAFADAAQTDSLQPSVTETIDIDGMVPVPQDREEGSDDEKTQPPSEAEPPAEKAVDEAPEPVVTETPEETTETEETETVEETEEATEPDGEKSEETEEKTPITDEEIAVSLKEKVDALKALNTDDEEYFEKAQLTDEEAAYLDRIFAQDAQVEEEKDGDSANYVDTAYQSNYFYNQLTKADEISFYERTYDALNKILKSSYDIHSGSFFTCVEYSGIDYRRAFRITDMVALENPQFYFIWDDWYGLKTFSSGKSIYIMGDIRFTDGALRSQYYKQIKTEANKVITAANQKTSINDKIKVILNYFYDNIEFIDSAEKTSIAGAFLNRKCYGTGYALAVEYLFNAVGIETIVVRENGYTSWNRVKLNSTWYELDVGWATGYRNLGFEDPEQWLFKSTDTFVRQDNGHHAVTTSFFDGFILPSCPEDYEWTAAANNKTVMGISVSEFPNDCYLVGQSLNINGAYITVEYKDGTSKLVAVTSKMVSGFTTAVPGVYTLTITYSGKKCEFEYCVEDGSNVKSISMQTLPTYSGMLAGNPNSGGKPRDYFMGQAFDPDGGEIKVTYSGGATRIIPLELSMCEVEPFLTQAGNNTVYVNYGGCRTSFQIYVSPSTVKSINFYALPSKTTYYKYVDTELDLTDLSLEVQFANNCYSWLRAEDYSEITATGFDPNKLGTQKITVRYRGKSVTYNITVALDPENAPVVMNGKGYETVTASLKDATEAGYYYEIEIKKDITDNQLSLPKTAGCVWLYSSNGSVLKTSSITANCDLVLSCPLEGAKNGTKTALKGANDKTITINCKEDLGAVTGTKTANLIIKNSVNAVSIATFDNVIVEGNNILSVSDKVSAVNEFSGFLYMTTPLAKSTAQINTFKSGKLLLMNGAKDTKTGKFTLPKVTINDISDNLYFSILSDSLLPDGQPILYAGGKTDFCDKITIDNATEAHPKAAGKIKAFMYGKEIRAEYADALTLQRGGNYSRNFPNFETLFNFINSDSQYNTGDTLYIIFLNGDISPDKFVLPTKAGSQILFLGNNHTLTLPGISTLSPKYGLWFNDLTLNNVKNGKETLLTISAGTNSFIQLDNVKTSIIKELKGTKTSALYVLENDISVQNVNTFGRIDTVDTQTASCATLNVTGKVSGVGYFNGNLALTTPKATCTAAIDDFYKGTLYLTATDKDRNGNYIIPKATIKNIIDGLKIDIVDSGFNKLTIPDGQPILYTSGKDDYKNKITVDNATESCSDTSKIGAFLYNKEYRAEYAEALYLDCENQNIEGYYPNFTVLFDAINKDTAYNSSDKWYEIKLMQDMHPDKFNLPSKCGAGIWIWSDNNYSVVLPGTLSISPKSNFWLENVSLWSIDPKKGNYVPIAINSNNTVTFIDAEFYGSVKADEFIIKEYKYSYTTNTVLTGMDVNTLKGYRYDYEADYPIKMTIFNNGQYKIKKALYPCDGKTHYDKYYDDDGKEHPYTYYNGHGYFEITVKDRNWNDVIFPENKITTIFSSYKTSLEGGDGSEYIRITNNGGLTPFVKQGKLVVEPLSKPLNWSTTTYRALLIGNDFFGNGTCIQHRNHGDVTMMKNVLNSVKGPEGGRYHITTGYDMSAEQVLNAIDTAFKDADENDVSLFFISTHGEATKDKSSENYLDYDHPNKGFLQMSYGDNLQLGTLARKLAGVKGKIIVMLGSCGSGTAIEPRPNSDDDTAYVGDFDPDAFNDEVIKAFAAVDQYIPSDDEVNSGDFLGYKNKFYVLTAADYEENSWAKEEQVDKYYNYFMSLIYDAVQVTGKMPADTNKDGILTLDELYKYIYPRGMNIYESTSQHAQVYPVNSNYPLFKR